MKLKHFVGGSAVILAGWLGVTFMLEVPARCYQQRHSAVAGKEQAGREKRTVLVLADSGPEISQLSVSP